MKTKIENFDDIIFENRYKEYGAYELRSKYSKRGTIALTISMIFMAFAVGGPLIASILKQRDYKRYLEQTTTMEMEKVKIEREDITPPPPPPLPPTVKEIKFIAPKIVEELTEPDKDFVSFDELSKSVGNGGAVDTSSKVIIEIVDQPKEKIVDEKVFEIFNIQEKPMFEDGDAALIRYVAAHTKYPVPAQEQGIEGTVYIRFVVTKTGDVGQASVMRAVDPMLEEEALRVVKSLPRWTPGKNNGNPVNVWFIIPVKFKLQ
jgi:periplasmic protein TonB